MVNRLPLLLLVLLFAAMPVLAQEDDGSQQASEAAPAGIVTGVVANGTTDGSVPDSGEPMLHIWDGAFDEKGMEHGQLVAGGAFRFEEVPFVPGWQYAVMLNYRDVTYFSRPTTVAADQDELVLEVPIYEPTTSTDALRVTRQHVLFDAAAEGQLMVGEIYVLSNEGKRTIVAPEGTAARAPLHFPLPAGASNVRFEGAGQERFRLVEGGFVDTTALRPGEGSSQVVVQYTLPYEEGMTYTFKAPWPVDDLNLLLPAATGLSLEGEGLGTPQRRQMSNGGDVLIFNRGAMEAGKKVQVNLSGELVAPAPAAAAAPPSSSPAPAAWQDGWTAPVAVTLGILLLALAVWLHIRPQQPARAAQPDGATFDAVIEEIALLDQAHDQGRLDDGDYERRRGYLFREARRLFPEESGELEIEIESNAG